MKKLGLMALSLLTVVGLCAGDVFADNKTYVWTQEYKSLPQNTVEVEAYTTLTVPDGKESAENEWEYQGAVEYGVTDHLTLAHYQRWLTTNQIGVDENGAPNKDITKYEGFKFEAKYRFGEKGKYWLDPLIYIEWATDPQNDDNPNTIETKVVLSKDLGKFNFTYNQIMENELGSGGRMNNEFAVASNYEILSDFFVGFEFTGQYWAPSTHRNEIALGPTVAWQNQYFWVALGGLFGLNNATDDYKARLAVGVPF